MAKRRGRGKVQGNPDQRANKAFQQRSKIAHTEVGLEYNPAIRQARAEARGSTKRQQQIGDWYNQIAADYQQGAQNAQQAYTTAEQATTQRLAQAGQQNAENLKEQAASDASTSSLLGAPTDTKGLAQAAAGVASLGQQQIDLAAPLTAQRANYTSYLGSRATSARMRGVEARKAESTRRQKIVSDIAAARREKGQAQVADIEKLTKADREAASERAALGLKAQQYGVTNRQAQARIGIERQNSAISAQNAATSARSQHTTAHHYKEENRNARRKRREEAKGGGLTPSEQRSAREERRSAAASVKTIVQTEGMPKNAKEWGALERIASEQGGSNPAQVRAVVAKLRKRAARQGRRKHTFRTPHLG